MTTNQEELKFMSEFVSLLKIQEDSFRPLTLGNKDNSSKKNTHTTHIGLFLDAMDDYIQIRDDFLALPFLKTNRRSFVSKSHNFIDTLFEIVDAFKFVFDRLTPILFIQDAMGVKNPKETIQKIKNSEFSILKRLYIYSGIMKIDFDVYCDSIQKILNPINILVNDFHDYLYTNPYIKDEFNTYEHNVRYQEIYNYLLKIDSILFGSSNTNLCDSSQMYDIDFFKDPLMLLDESFDSYDALPFSKPNVKSLFICFLKDLQIFRVRFLGILKHLAIKMSSLDFDIDAQGIYDIILKEKEYFDYFDDNTMRTIDLTFPIIQRQKISEHIIKTHSLSLHFRDFPSNNESLIKNVCSFFDKIFDLFKAKGINIDVFFENLKKVVITKDRFSNNGEKTFRNRLCGQFFENTQHIALYVDEKYEFKKEKYLKIKNFDRVHGTEKELLEAPRVLQLIMNFYTNGGDDDDFDKFYDTMFCDLIVFVLMHELGHYLHLTLISQNARDTWTKDYWGLRDLGDVKQWYPTKDEIEYVSKYAMSDPQEDFAETFAYFMVDAIVEKDSYKKRFDYTMLDAKKDNFDLYANPLVKDDTHILYNLTSELIAKYIGAMWLGIDQTFAFVIPEPWNKHIYFENENSLSMVGFEKASEYIRIDHRPLYCVAIKHEFHLLEMPQKIEILLQTIIPLYCLSFIEFFGSKAFDTSIKLIGINVSTQKSLLSKLDTITRLIMLDIENGCEYNKHTSNKTMLFFRHIVKAIYSVFVHTKAFEVESLFGNIHEYDTYEDMPLTQQVALRKTQKSFSFKNKKS